MDAILSIKPKHIKNIISGKKTYEYRKRVFKKNVDKVYMYSSYPEQKVVGYFNIAQIVAGNPFFVWNLTNDLGCLTDTPHS
tara:strand:- start:28 stop:270 length:243 start_codon:yes stop_codon:yes gene_type:complete